MKSKTTIELNGRRYDAITGTMLGAASAPPVRTGRNIDGFFRARATTATPPVSDKITVLAAPAPAPKPHHQPNRTVNHARPHTPEAARTVSIRASSKPQTQKITVHHTATASNHVKHHVAQNSTTLMRESVKRPAPSLLKQIGTKGALQHAAPSLIVSKQAAVSVDAARLARAQSTARSPHISRHATAHHVAIQPQFTPVAVQPTPINKPSAVPSAPAPTPTNKPSDDIFTHALANATHFVDIQAHKKHFKTQGRRHVTSMAAGTLALLVIAGFAAYQNTPGLQLRVASIQAGVSTNMPNFKAAGFAYNGVRAGDGKLTVGFSSTNGNYQLVQQTTNLSGSDVIKNISATDASGNPDYTTVQAGGTTVYRFANTNATWVANGKWYTVNGTSSLSDQQVETLVQNV